MGMLTTQLGVRKWSVSDPSMLALMSYMLPGNVTYLDQADATSKKLAFINGAGNAVVAVDNTTTLVAGPPGQAVNRNSVRGCLASC